MIAFNFILIIVMWFALGYYCGLKHKKFNSNERKSVRKHSKAKEFCDSCKYREYLFDEYPCDVCHESNLYEQND